MVMPVLGHAHEMTPTYPTWKIAYFRDLLVTEMEMFNKRADIEYYEVGVFDENWNPIPFVSSFKLFKLEYLSRIKFEVYIREQDKVRAKYICSKSKLREGENKISSKICSRFK